MISWIGVKLRRLPGENRRMPHVPAAAGGEHEDAQHNRGETERRFSFSIPPAALVAAKECRQAILRKNAPRVNVCKLQPRSKRLGLSARRFLLLRLEPAWRARGPPWLCFGHAAAARSCAASSRCKLWRAKWRLARTALVRRQPTWRALFCSGVCLGKLTCDQVSCCSRALPGFARALSARQSRGKRFFSKSCTT